MKKRFIYGIQDERDSSEGYDKYVDGYRLFECGDNSELGPQEDFFELAQDMQKNEWDCDFALVEETYDDTEEIIDETILEVAKWEKVAPLYKQIQKELIRFGDYRYDPYWGIFVQETDDLQVFLSNAKYENTYSPLQLLETLRKLDDGYSTNPDDNENIWKEIEDCLF